jgi:hypothetical protein
MPFKRARKNPEKSYFLSCASATDGLFAAAAAHLNREAVHARTALAVAAGGAAGR